MVYHWSMVIRRTRALFAVLLTFALLPIVSTMVTGAPDSCAGAARAWMQSSAKSESGVQPARESGTATKHHPDATPFTVAEQFQLGLCAPIASTGPASSDARSASAPVALHPARAPPALL